MDEMTMRDNAAKALIDVEYHPVLKDEQPDIVRAVKIPFERLAAIGAGFASLPESFRTVTQTTYSDVSGLYRMVIPDTASGTLVQKNGITLGNMVGTDGHTFSGRARFVQASSAPSVTTTTLPFDPTSLFMAAALVSVEKKLDDIRQTQVEILEYLKEDKKSRMRGNLTFLADISNKYKYNWNNSTYISGMHMKVEDINQESVQNIDFYRSQIRKIAGERGLIIGDQDIKKQVHRLKSEFRNYQLAVYLYGFSSFLEVMLLKNFDPEYLQRVIQGIESYSLQYRELYTDCYNLMEDSAQTSLQKHVLDGMAAISGATGETIARIPVISRSQLDETLIESRNRLSRFSTKRAEKMVGKLIDNRDCGVGAFVESIKTVGRIYNEPVELMFDSKNLYMLR